MKGTAYINEITNQKDDKYLSGEKSSCLLALCTEKCFPVFDQSSCVIYPIWYWSLLFLWGFSSSFLLWYDFKILVKSRGGGTFLSLALSVNVWQK